MNKKGQMADFGKILTIMLIVAVFTLAMLFGLMIYNQIAFPQQAEQKCHEAGLSLFDSSSGNIFQGSSITCIDNQTKEITKIR